MDDVSSVYAAGRNGDTDLRLMALKTDDSLWAWGRNGNTSGEYGRIGDGTKENRAYPINIFDNVDAVYVIDNDNTAVIERDGTMWGWGVNKNGELGDGTTTSRLSPVQIRFVPQSTK